VKVCLFVLWANHAVNQICVSICSKFLTSMMLKTMSILKNYNSVDWRGCKLALKKMQNDLVVIIKSNDFKLVRQIQNTIVRSFAKWVLVIRRICTNGGSMTSGIDVVTWNNLKQRLKDINALRDLKIYISKPVRHVCIPKSNGSKRPLGIPTSIE